jgi:hypothetical protein
MTLTMTGRLAECVLLVYRMPKDAVQHLVPAGLELVRRGEWAFWNIVVCRVEAMRLAGLPRGCGVSYLHVAYRLYVQEHGAGPERLEGLFFVRSDVNHRWLAAMGNLVSDFRFHHSRIALTSGTNEVELCVRSSGAEAAMLAGPGGAGEWTGSPGFVSRDEAARFLKYRPLGLACDTHGLKLAEVFRDEREWCETPLRVQRARWQFLEKFGEHALELATRIAPIEYRWRLGRRRSWPEA